MEISIVWRRKSLLKEGETTDQEGYAPMEFNFVNGQNVVAEVKEHIRGASAYQETLFASKCYLTEVETWIERGNKRMFIYACPSLDIRKRLPKWSPKIGKS